MTFFFGSRSLKSLATTDPQLNRVCIRALDTAVIDFTVIQGHRTEAAQNEAFARGYSKVQWPNGKHNSMPSRAVDLLPIVPKSVGVWGKEALPYWYLLAGVVLAAAAIERVPLRWGGDFNMNRDLTEKEFKDLGHFELR